MLAAQPHQVLGTLGLCLDIAGGLLVAVEAIRIENLRRFRDWLRRQRRDVQALKGCGGTTVSFASALLIVWLALFVVLPSTAHNGHPHGWQLLLAIPILVLAVPAMFVAITGAVLLFDVFAAVVERVDAATPNGTSGLVGAALLVTGFAFQISALWA